MIFPLLSEYGIELIIDEAYDFIVAMSTGENKMPEIANWLLLHSK
jgi:hypothetical protein